jgi:ABC-type transport system involved in multi-copper enzyme maturation permease subunit/ABC-type uncharacterized transport system involved in gliding motility auxiliary subunit
MTWKAIWTIARREVKSLFDQPTGYVLLIVFLGVNAFLFFRNIYVANVASLRPMLDFMPWVFLFFVPAIAMRSLAEDTRGGLLEIVLAQPVSEAQLLLGKYLGVLLVLAGALASTLLVPIGLSFGSDLPWGPVVAQYLGALLLAAAFAGVGVWASSLTKSQITAFILAVTVMFVLILVGLDPMLVGLPPLLGSIAARLGVLSHFQSIGRGVLDLRDVLYFLSVAALFLALAFAVLMRRRLAHASPAARQLRLGTGLLCAIVIALNLAGGQIGGRIDLTPGNAYTLSPATRAIARAVPDLVTIKLFSSAELPAEFALTKRDVTDLLRDIRSAGGGKIRVIEQDPASDSAVAEEARTLGITPVQFNVVGQTELTVKDGFFGMVIQHADRREAIPFIRRSDDLEYRLATGIRNLVRSEKPRVALVTDPPTGSYALLREELGKSYTVETASLSDSASLASVAALVVAASRDSASPGEEAAIAAYLAGGGKALIMESGMMMSPQMPLAQGRTVTWNAALAPYGVKINQDMVYDLRANQVVGVPTEFGQILRPYPYFIRAQSTKAAVTNAELGEVGLAWTSSIDTSTSKSTTVTPLFVTSEAAGVSAGTAMLDPSQRFPTTGLGRRILGVQVTPKEGEKGPRLVVMGNATLASDEFARRGPEGVLFVLNAVDWLAQDEALIAIRAKDRRPPALVYESDALKQGVKYLNVVGLPLAFAIYGVLRLLKRRRLAATPYRPAAEAA